MKTEDDYKVVIVRRFYFESKAQLYAARLKDEGIYSFISNRHTGIMLPVGSAPFALHVRSDMLIEAKDIIHEMDSLESSIPEESFVDASQGDIDYQRRLHRGTRSKYSALWIVVVLVLITTLIVASILSYAIQ